MMIKHLDELVRQAKIAQTRAYAPYSKYKVGAALMMDDNTYVLGANIENDSYPLSNCAERSALFGAYSKGYRKDNILAIAIVSDSLNTSPCGACRQVMLELMKEDAPVFLVNGKNEVREFTVKDLLPYGFTAEELDQ